MRALIDAHTLLWSVESPSSLGPSAWMVVHDPANDRVLSIGTIWELSIKVGPGKLSISGPFRPWIEQAIADLAITLLPIDIAHAEAQASLPHHHRDSFDRLLIAQAIVEGLPILSVDAQFDRYGVARIW